MSKNNITISVIIPSFYPEREKNVLEIIRKLRADRLPPDEIVVIKEVAPAGKARNLGVERSSGDILIFIDDDAIIESDDTLSKVVEALLSDDNIGMAGAVQKPCPDMNWLQKAYRKQFPRTEAPTVNEIKESDMVTTLFCAIRRDDFIAAGGFDERLIAGQDNLLRHKIRQMGKKIVLVPETLVYHPLPRSIANVLKREIIYAHGMAQLSKLNLMPLPAKRIKNMWQAFFYALVRIIALPVRLFYGGPDGKSFGFWYLRAPAWLVNSIAYAWFSAKTKNENSY